MRNMETSDESKTLPGVHTSDDIMDTAFVDRLKVAAAAAIIKQKPVSMTGKEYAQLLAKKLQERENSWKAKAKQLERELLKTRQELLLVKANLPDRNISKDSRRREICNSSSGSSTGEDAFPTPPSSSENCHHSDLEGALSANTKFLHSLSCLSVASDPEARSELASPEVIVESVRSATDFIWEGQRGGSSTSATSSRLARQAVESLAKVVDSPAANGCRMELVTITTKLVEGILGEMLRNSNKCNVHSLQESSNLVSSLSKSRHLCPVIIQTVLQKIEKVSASLRNTSHHRGHHLDVDLLESSYFLFSTLEDILISQLAPSSSSSSSSQLFQRGSHLGKARQVTSSLDDDENTSASLCNCRRSRSSVRALALTRDFRTNILQRLEDSLLHLSQDFPLYAQYVWRLTGILEMMSEQ
ncbi:meiosis-specific protein MEI4-like [Diadema setosum]|uniref:meiosis-specific protein MEI4-like n=1 Tax=Diadema setosum TaxID=31175 RepID=UPI003B3BA299